MLFRWTNGMDPSNLNQVEYRYTTTLGMKNQNPSNLDLVQLPIVDSYGRKHNSLRISVTDRCNIRCFYCMPLNVQFLPRSQLLTYEEITRVIRIVVDCGVNKIRITGGEPLVRSDLPRLIEMIANIRQIDDVALTTNGLLLAQHADALYRAGLNRLNISLDALNPETFEQIARRKGLEQVLEGIDAAIAAGFKNIRLNAVSICGLTESEIVPLAQFSRAKKLTLRFIEFMPLDAEQNWVPQIVLSGSEVKQIIHHQVAPLAPHERDDPAQPAVDFRYLDGGGTVGFINSVTEPFCENCNRMRMTAEGKFRNCLFSQDEWDVRELLRQEASDSQIEAVIRECIQSKKAGHGTDTYQFHRPDRTMHQIGG